MAKKRYTKGITKNCEFGSYENEVHTWCSYHEKWVLACVYCDRAFHTTRTDALYCEDACRQGHHRKNQMILPGFSPLADER
jgi:hypothetical protein